MKNIPLTRGLSVIVDDQDHEWLAQRKWCASPTQRGTFYAARSERREDGRYSTILMHRLILCAGPGLHTDHINGDTLDNRRINLRAADHSQNQANRGATRSAGYSAIKGVTWHIRDKRWVARIVVRGAAKHLGYFTTEAEAAAAYETAARSLFGEFSSYCREEICS